MYRTLDNEKTISTLNKLISRIRERFPESGLQNVCEELFAIAGETRGKIARLSRPNIGVRISIGVVLLLAALTIGTVFRWVRVRQQTYEFAEFVQMVEAGTNVVVLSGAALFFLVTMETRIKRGRALKSLHELRTVAHVIDMHQLTKDPSQLLSANTQRTASSPKRTLTPFQLMRYLDYCSEMLSLIGKLAAVYPQTMFDEVVLQSVNDIETLTNGLSRKIWQKIMILEEELRRAGESSSIVAAPKPPTTEPDLSPPET
jgi:hypothetical protein